MKAALACIAVAVCISACQNQDIFSDIGACTTAALDYESRYQPALAPGHATNHEMINMARRFAFNEYIVSCMASKGYRRIEPPTDPMCDWGTSRINRAPCFLLRR